MVINVQTEEELELNPTQLSSTSQEQEKVLQKQWCHFICHPIKFKRLGVIFLLLLMITISSLLAFSYYRQHRQSELMAENQDGNGSNNGDNDEYSSKQAIHLKSQMYSGNMDRERYYKPELPLEYGYFNVYIREPMQYGSRSRSIQRFRFPAVRYTSYRFPLIGPFLNFRLNMPIFVHPTTRQTIIRSSKGSIYVLPPLSNVYGKIFSIGELIVSGYASFMSNGIGRRTLGDVKTLFHPGSLMGPGIPRFNPFGSGFISGIRTRYHSSFPPRFPRTLIYDRNSYFESEDEYDYQPPSSYNDNYYEQQPYYKDYKVASTTTIITATTATATTATTPTTASTY